MKKYKKSYCLIFLLFTFVTTYASDAALADSAYLNDDYEEAVALYTQVLDEGKESAGLLYNLGNSFYRLGNDGKAMVCYERAKKIDPSNKLIKENLEFLQNKIQKANESSLMGKPGNVKPDEESFIENLYRIIAIERQSNGWAVLAVISFILFLGGLALYMFTPNVLARKTGFFSALVFLAFTSCFVIFSFLGAHQYQRDDEAVLTAFTTELLERPEEKSSPVSSPLHKGTKLKILETMTHGDDTWYKVRLNSENVGWVKKEGVEII